MTEVGPLAGLRVLEIGGGIAAAVCCRLLRGFGAETVRYELPDQQLSRDDEIFLVSGSKRVAADPDTLERLAFEADVIIEDQRPDWLAEHGLDPVELRRERPELVVTSISPFGQTGPQAKWQTTNVVQFAVGGLMTLTGDAHRPPLVTGGNQAFFLAGLHGFAATATVLLGRRRSGIGNWIDLSMQEASASMPELYAARSEYETGEPCVRDGNSVRSTWGVYRCADGFAGVCCLERQIPALFSLLGEEVTGEERFADPLVRAEHDDELLAHIMSFMLSHTKDELLELGQEHRIPTGAVRTPVELLADETHQARGFFDHVKVDEGMATMPGRPFPGLAWTPPDRLKPVDEAAVAWAERKSDAWTVPPPGTGAEPESRPFEGLRVLDLTAFWAGPYATMLLAETGAEIIKIESPSAWDNIRTLIPQDPSIEDPWNSSFYFNEYNHSKKSLTLDLAQEEGRRLFLQFVEGADVVIENYRADVLDNLGLGYDILRAANPDIVFVSMAGFGKTGELRGHVGFGPIIEMMSGLMSLTGYGATAEFDDDEVPYKTGISYGDPVGGLHAVAAVALSLIERERSGSGRHIDLSQRETASSMAGPAFVAASLRGEEPKHWGNRHPHFVPQGAYRAAGDDAWVCISVRTDDEWRDLCEEMALADLAGLSASERRDRHDELDQRISAFTEQRPPGEIQARLQARGVPAGAVVDTMAVHDDPQLLDRGFYQVVPHPKMRPYRQPGCTWRLVGGPGHQMHHSPLFGQHNDELLAELDLMASQLDQLERDGIIGTTLINPSVG